MARLNDTGRGDETAPLWREASAGAEDGARSAGHRRGERVADGDHGAEGAGREVRGADLVVLRGEVGDRVGDAGGDGVGPRWGLGNVMMGA